jgi:hypothetical protein
MINFFKTLNPLNVLWLAILLVALRAGYLLHTPAKIDFAFERLFSRLLMPASWQYPMSPVFNVSLACFLVFVQALFLNHLVNHFNLLGKPTFLPALMYITVSSLFTPFLILSPPLICNFLVIWMLFKLLSFYKSKDTKSAAYDLGMMVAIGTLIYLPFIYYLLAIWIALVIFNPFNWREWAAGIMGYITIIFFLAVYYYLNNSLEQFYEIWLPLATKFPDSIDINYYNYLVLIPVVVILVLCFFKLQQNFFRSYVQVRKSFQLLFIVFLIAGLSFYVMRGAGSDIFFLLFFIRKN